MQYRLAQLGLQSVDVLVVQEIVSLDLYHISYMGIATIICLYVLLEFNTEIIQKDLLRARYLG